MKLFKKFLSLVCILVTLVLLVQAPVANADDFDTKLTFNKTYYNSMEYLDSHDYNFSVSQKTTFKIELYSDECIELNLYEYEEDDEGDDKVIAEDTYISKTITVNKGEYAFVLWAWDDDTDYSFRVSVENAKSIKFDSKTTKVKLGKSKTLKIKTVPANANVSSLTWSSSNTSVAKVSKSGKVTAKGYGKVTITAKTKNGKKAKCTVIVNEGKTIEIHKNASIKLPKINGKYKTGWKSKKSSIAKSGSKVTGKKGGTTTVYKKVSGVTYSCKIKVVDPYSVLSKGKAKLKKKYLYYPSSLESCGAWRAYWKSDKSAVVIYKYKARSLYGYKVTEYAVFWKDGSDVTYRIYDYMPHSKQIYSKVRI